MNRLLPISREIAVALASLTLLMAAPLNATYTPEQVATVVVHGFDPSGVQDTGIVGNDRATGYITKLAGVLGLPTSVENPIAKNQVAYTTYYGNQYPDYYTPQDQQDVIAAGAGVPRYATIIAKYSKEVLRRSGAKQVNIFAVSFGGLVSRYMIEKDVEGLASSGKIARWISVEGVVAGNWAATTGGQYAEDVFEEYYETEAVDLQHMNYEWVQDNIHNPRKSSSSPFLGEFPVHFWQASDDNMNERALSFGSRKANDGVVLIEDAVLTNLPSVSKYLGLAPTVSATHTTHEGTKDFEGIRAGVAAQIFGRKRVSITLSEVRVREEFDGSYRGDGEYVFGVKVFSPMAETQLGIVKPVHQLRSDDNNLPYIRMERNTTRTVNLTWFDDMILPGETELRLDTNVTEIDGDLIYGILEDTGELHEELANATQLVSTEVPGTYTIETRDWRGLINVEIKEYPPFQVETAVEDWHLY